MSIDESFAKLVGRQASEHERERLYRLRDALGLQDNDAFWAIVMALEHYDSFFRQYPRQLAEEAGRTIESARVTFAAAAAHEAAHVQRVLADQVAETSVTIARKLAERPVGVHRVTLVLAAVVAFGALCVNAGYNLAGTARPFWVSSESNLKGAQRVLAVLLGVPAGWMVFALLVPAAAYGVKVGWVTAVAAEAARRERTVGWCIMTLCVVFVAACALTLVHVT